jgi:hypothetical protein
VIFLLAMMRLLRFEVSIGTAAPIAGDARTRQLPRVSGGHQGSSTRILWFSKGCP